MADATRTADPSRSARRPAASPANAIAATVEWIRMALACEPASVQLLLPDDAGRLRVFAASGGSAPGGRKRSSRRRQALAERRPITIDLAGEGRTVAIVPLVADGAAVGIVEVVAPARAFEQRGAILDAVVAQSALVVRSVLEKHRSDAELDEQGALLGLAGDLLLAESAEAAVRAAVTRCSGHVGTPIAGLLVDRSGRGWSLAAARGLGSAKRAELRRAAAGIRTRGRYPSVADRLAARFATITDTRGIAGIGAGDAVLVARAQPEHGPFLHSAAAMLRDALQRIGTVSWAQVRNEDLDLAIATTAHELKEPLVGVRAALERVVVADGDPGGRELLRRSRGELDRLAELVDPLLRWSAGSGPLSMRRVDLVRVVRDAVASCSLGCDGVRVQVRAARPVWVQADPAELGGAVANVIRNALAYSPADTPVTVKVAATFDGAVVTVRDRGPGVPAAERRTIFDPFARGGAGVQARGGKGLGLFIARRVVEAHGGSIELSGVRTGAEFSIELPVLQEGRSLSAS